MADDVVVESQVVESVDEVVEPAPVEITPVPEPITEPPIPEDPNPNVDAGADDCCA